MWQAPSTQARVPMLGLWEQGRHVPVPTSPLCGHTAPMGHGGHQAGGKVAQPTSTNLPVGGAAGARRGGGTKPMRRAKTSATGGERCG